MKLRLLDLLGRMLIILSIGALGSCEDAIETPYEHFLIPEGKHAGTTKVESLQSSSIRFQAIFNESAVYRTETEENQHDINKLIGFADCNSHHHQNSARFGWRWLEGNLEIHAYAYVNGERITQFLGTVALNDEYNYQVELTPEAYIFSLEGFDPVEVSRGDTCQKGLYYMLYPYFGGNETAPHDILIQILMHY